MVECGILTEQFPIKVDDWAYVRNSLRRRYMRGTGKVARLMLLPQVWEAEDLSYISVDLHGVIKALGGKVEPHGAVGTIGFVPLGDDRWEVTGICQREPFGALFFQLVQDLKRRWGDGTGAPRRHIEDIDSFRKVREVEAAAVSHLLSDEGYLDQPEDFIQRALEQILNVPFHKQDWGGEINDLYTANVVVNGSRTPTAFLLKGRGTKHRVLEISDCGQNGDQLARLFDSPAQLFVVQFVGEISDNVIRDVEGKVKERRSTGESAWYCTMNGQDTARLLHAYGKL
ncbi:MAG: hypothetical protein M1546_20130 [Chloroflexi bacterium]|nr:hypothetical protein [Chloroflexota bacterium]